MAADLPADLVTRPHEFEAVKQSLLSTERSRPTAITAALQGAGGYGKTMLALMLCHDREIREAFLDGILWVTLGEKPVNVIAKIEELILVLSNERLSLVSMDAAITKLRETLADSQYLLVIDDIWRSSDLAPFLQGGPRCARLLTTRNEQDIPSTAIQIQVDAMRQQEATQLLQTGLQQEATEEQFKPLFEHLAVQLGEWPLLLTLANGVLRQHLHQHEPLQDALTYLQQALEKRGVVAFDARNTDARREAVARTIEVSLELLTPEEVTRYHELAIFPEDVDIPLKTVQQLWQTMANFDAFDTVDLCSHLAGLSLLLTYDLSTRSIRLHDVIRHYLQIKMRAELPALHGQFLDSYRLSRWGDLSIDEPYLWQHLIEHLIAAQRAKCLLSAAKDLRYLATKTWKYGVSAVERDLQVVMNKNAHDPELALFHRLFFRAAHLLSQGQTSAEIQAMMLTYCNQTEDGKVLYPGWQHEPITGPSVLPWHSLPLIGSNTLLRTLSGHTGSVTGCAVSSDGKWIVSASEDRTLKVWDVLTGAERCTLHGHTDSVTGCAISPDGKWIVSASKDETLKVRDVLTGTKRHTLSGHTGWVTGCTFSPDGKWIVSASEDRTLKIWDAFTGAERRTLSGHTDWVNRCAISPDGKWIVSASEDGTLKVWDTLTGAERHALHGHNRSVTGCAFSPDGKWIVSASEDRTLKIWDAFTGAERRTLSGHTGWVNGCAFSPDGKWIVSASNDKKLKVWDAFTGAEQHTLSGHTDCVTGCAFSPDGKWIVSASEDGTLKVWDALTGAERHTLGDHIGLVYGCAVSPDGKWIVSASKDETLKVWDALTRAERHILRGHTDSLTGCAISPDGKWIVSASADGTLTVWDALTSTKRDTLNGYTDWLAGCAISPDGKWIVSASADGTLTVWDALTGTERYTLDDHTGSVYGCAVSPDGKWIVSASLDKTLKVWDALTGTERYTLSGHTDSVRGCAISPNGKWIVSVSEDETLKVWNALTGAERYTLSGHTDSVRGCAISPDGKWIVSVSEDETLKVWDLNQGKCVTTFYADTPFFSCAWHPDGIHLIATGGNKLYFLRMVW
ncbi:hypothetical protein KSD_48190 [Ktedonobacter sp. SOSP1-85]|uniref:NB-ARC domain-containing protein n=1 Tax=Ktedonobacter sp. SOSP1-85 TaxID=2778367 RepID=UPI00191550A3|nr:NB-ARC domain-containing protein [Ktedonobacter sp. SOSP1-85]GHO77048.1 hypothetical protein KSD_48190 [Ktedonobacter sp. SOSP1-85]